MLIKNLWDIRGDLNNALITKDKQALLTVRYNLYNYFERPNKTMFKDFNKEYNNATTLYYAVRENINLILNNMDNYIDKYIKKRNVSTKFEGRLTNIGAVVWSMRSKFDYLIVQYEKSSDLVTKEDFNSIIDKLNFCIEQCTITEEKFSLHNIVNEVQLKINEIFGVETENKTTNC